MNEYAITFLSFAKLGVIGIFSLCYSLGGRAHKWIRRFLGGGVLALSLVGFALIDKVFSLWVVLLSPLVILWLCLPYSNDKNLGPILRFVYGLFIGLIGLGLGFACGNWGLGIYHVFICLSASLYLGLMNPLPAAAEETVIAALSTLLLPFIV